MSRARACARRVGASVGRPSVRRCTTLNASSLHLFVHFCVPFDCNASLTALRPARCRCSNLFLLLSLRSRRLSLFVRSALSILLLFCFCFFGFFFFCPFSVSFFCCCPTSVCTYKRRRRFNACNNNRLCLITSYKFSFLDTQTLHHHSVECVKKILVFNE